MDKGEFEAFKHRVQRHDGAVQALFAVWGSLLQGLVVTGVVSREQAYEICDSALRTVEQLPDPESVSIREARTLVEDLSAALLAALPPE